MAMGRQKDMNVQRAHDGTRNGRRRSAVLAALAMTLGLGLSLTGLSAAGAQENPEGPEKTSDISVVFTPAAEQGECLPAGLGLSYVVFSDDSVFRLTVTAASPQCTPIDASAVIYAMPGNGEAWPQELVERTPVVISEAGIYEITFSKHCDPVQFDVVTGATPQTITPLGEFHGPLLFPLDVETAQQYWGDAEGCIPTTTTTTTTTSTTIAPTTSVTPTTEPPEVLGSSTLPVEPQVAGVSTVAPVDAQVAGTSVTRSPAALALTGPTRTGLSALGALLLVGGMVLVVAQRRRSA